MPPKSQAELQRRVKEATALLAIAEKELSTAMNRLEVFERADKKMISKAVQVAVEKLAAAKRYLEAIVDPDPD